MHQMFNKIMIHYKVWIFLHRRRGWIMSERRLVSDNFTSMIEDLVYERKLSRERAEWYYRQATDFLGLLDARHPRLKGDALKAAIKSRLYSHTFYRPVPLPDRRKTLKELFRPAPPWKE